MSMEGKGRAWDNIFTERLGRSVKYEEVSWHDYDTPRQARRQISQYFTCYHHLRLPQSLGDETPAAWYHRQDANGPAGPNPNGAP